MRFTLHSIAAALCAVGCAAAGGEEPPQAGERCVPGIQIACACGPGAKGVQSCVPGGNAYTPCDCSGLGAGGAAGEGGSGNPPGTAGAPAGGSGGAPPAASGGSAGSTGGSGSTGGAGGGAGGASGWGGGAGFGGGSFGPVGDYAGGIAIQEIAIYQGVKISLMKNGQAVTQKNAPVVEGRPALIRVSVAPASGFQARKLAALLDLQSSNPSVKAQTTTLDVSGPSTDASLGSTFNFTLPADQVTADLKLAVSLHEPSGASVGAVQNGVAFPGQDKLALGAQSSGIVRLTIVPFTYYADGSARKPDTSNEQMQRYHDILFSMYPTSKVELTLRAPVDYQGYVGPSSGWSTWLDTLCDVRQTDNVDSKNYYYGIMAPASSWSSYGGGIAGLGNVPSADGDWGRCAVGLGFQGADTYGFLMAHEVGHTFGRPHAPCGTSGEPFPYPGATIGVWGYSLTSNKLKDPSEYRDVMSYCDPQWISDVNYGKLFKRIQWVSQNYYQTPTQPKRFEKLLVDIDGSLRWGGSVVLREVPDGRPTRIQLVTADGSATATATGYFAPFSEDPAGALFIPEPDSNVIAVQPEGLPAIALP